MNGDEKTASAIDSILWISFECKKVFHIVGGFLNLIVLMLIHCFMTFEITVKINIYILYSFLRRMLLVVN